MPRKIIISTAYLPPIDYMMWLYFSDEVLIEAYETYPRQTWRNRCRIVSANGLLDLSIPVEKPHNKPAITKEVMISTRHSWQKNHWRAIQSAYSKSPFFIYYKDAFEAMYNQPPPAKLLDWNYKLLEVIASQIIPLPQIKYTQEYQKVPADMKDLREAFSPKAHRQQQDISHQLPEYYQVFSASMPFQPNLSILDLLFNIGPMTIDYLRENAEKGL
ncbi:MAG: WbqC family protein [Bacteroidales bacterium]